MLYVIQHGDGSISKILPGNIVYCVIKIEDIIRNHVDCVFTDGHALDGFTRCYPASELSNLNPIVSYNDVFSQYWSKEEDKDSRKAKEKTEEIKRILNKLMPAIALTVLKDKGMKSNFCY